MADYVTTEPAFDFERGDFVIINGRPKMVVGMDRLRSWIGKVDRKSVVWERVSGIV